MREIVKATKVDDIEAASSVPGAFEILCGHSTGKPSGMLFVCPCGCGTEGFLPFRDETDERPSWIWNGDRDKPTLNPSVFARGRPCQWHGWLTDGEWRPC